MPLATPKLPEGSSPPALAAGPLQRFISAWKNPAAVFAVLACCFGTLFLAITPPMQVPDEPLHFYQAYSVAYGNLLDKSATQIPLNARTVQKSFEHLIGHPERKTSPAQILEAFQVPLDPEKRGPDSTFGNPFLTYAFGALGIRLGAALELPPVALMYLGRFFTFLFWFSATYLAIRLSPILKWTLCALALTPMSVFEGASLSADSFTNAWCFLFIAYVFHLSYGPRNTHLRSGDYALLLLLSLPVTFSKFVYGVLILLFWLIPGSRFPSKGVRWLSFFGLSGIHLALFAWWMSLKSKLGLPPPFPDVSASRQLAHLKADLWNYWDVVWRSLSEQGEGYWKAFVGILGWLDTVLPDYVYYLYFGIFVLLWAADKTAPRAIRWADRIWAFSALILGLALVLTSQYLLWTSVGKGTIDGVQGRYFIPLSPLPFFAFFPPRILRPILDKISAYVLAALPAFMALGLALALRGILLRYY